MRWKIESERKVELPSQQPLSIFRRGQLWLGGYAPTTLVNETQAATHSIAMTGGLIGVAAGVTALSWGTAGYWWTEGSPVVATFAAIAGSVFAISIDRTGAYSLDAQAGGWWKKAMIFGLRAGVSVLVSGITTEALAPAILHRDADRVALKQREANDLARSKDLVERFNVAGLRAAVTRADENVRRAQTAIDTVPKIVITLQGDAESCTRKLAARRAALAAKGVDDAGRRHQLATAAARCRELTSTARRELEAHHNTSQKLLAEAGTEQSIANSALKEAESDLKRQLKEARSIETKSITGASSFVLDSLLATSWAAWRKVFGYSFLMLAFELLPLVFKLMGGRSIIGMRLVEEYELARARHVRCRAEEAHSETLRHTVQKRLDGALEAALDSSKVQERLTEMVEEHAMPLVTLSLARQTIAEIGEFNASQTNATCRSPDLAGPINAFGDSIVEDILGHEREEAGQYMRPLGKAA